MSIRSKLLILMIAIAVIPMTVIGVAGYLKIKQLVGNSERGIITLAGVRTVADLKQREISLLFREIERTTEFMTSSFAVRDNFRTAASYVNEPQSKAYKQAEERLDDRAQTWLRLNSSMHDIILVDANGVIVHSALLATKEMLRGQPLEQIGDVNISEFQDRRGRFFAGDLYTARDDKQRYFFVSAPITDERGEFAGNVVVVLNLSPFRDAIIEDVSLGKTGELLLAKRVGNSVFYLNDLVGVASEGVPLQIPIEGNEEVPAVLALTTSDGAGIMRDYKGKEVFAAWRKLPTLEWGIVVKKDATEINEDIDAFALFLQAVIVMVALLSAGGAWLVAYSIVKPIDDLRKTADAISMGKLDVATGGVERKDEIGALARAFDRTIVSLKLAMRESKSGENKSSESSEQPRNDI